ncbi:MAG: DUF1289 domain-containing protein [Burkholderiales bacterium]|nr:DUF1289 domain-containing protein [Burkholderiales bacterium]MDP2399809.1 DUF1289 domain-containing protein [Burkholderiales bacterium]MDP3715040.1 DUF1289 domain-containing protein [Burkholderiales bacterium]
MTTPDHPPQEVESPCVRICMIDPGHDFCVGCWRTLQEISDWHRYTPSQKLALLARLEDRRIACSVIN